MNIKAIFGGERKKLLLQIISIGLLVFLLLVFGDTARQWWGMRQADKAAEALKQFEEEATARMMADTVGGKTPQETLQMYIEAVEKGDFEGASKYLVENQRGSEKEELSALKEKNNLVSFLNILKVAEVDEGVSDDAFRMKSKTEEGPYYFVRFVKYPNGIWKIVEI